MASEDEARRPVSGEVMDSIGISVRTSLSHPLHIDEVKVTDGGGIVGITFCPGKRGDSTLGYRWERDLHTDLDTIDRWQPAAMVTLLEEHEFTLLNVQDLGAQVSARGIDWHHLPIADVQPPNGRFEIGWRSSGPKLCRLIKNGRRVLVHCRGGRGRAGMVAALMLIELGTPASDAVRRVRAVRPQAIETKDQLRYILDWRRSTG